MTHYPPTPGIADLRSALAEYHGKYGINWKPSEVIVTAGSSIALYVAMAGILSPGDEVVLLEPYFMAYRGLLSYLGANQVPVPLTEETNWHIDLEALKEVLTQKTKMIVVCSPNNPSGTVFTKKELNGIAEIAIDNNIVVLSDEVYNEFVWDGRKHLSIAAESGMRENTIVCGSFSKTWAMTGWRLGFVLADQSLATHLVKIPVGYRPTAFVQQAGYQAVKGQWGPVEEMIVTRLNEIKGIECQMPEGAFYVFPNIKAIGQKSEKFCEGLLKEEKVLVFPGTTFGYSGEYHVRIPLIKSIEIMEKAYSAIESYAKRKAQ
ncbi:MAG: pyridoxal phosphate-dependent aminotransferase, partial [Promethearchaeota archaeon]|jgi:aspartate/methionine/tyrosine aminotransferase